MNSIVKFGVPLVLVGAVLYQTLLKTVIFTAAGVGRHVQPISDFPYDCRRITDPRLQACEDMWLSENTRQLFLACSESSARAAWMPNVLRFNATGRSMTDAVVAMDIDSPSFRYRVLEPSGYDGVTDSDKRLHLVGLTGIDGEENVELFLVNAKPSVDPATGKIIAQETAGANSTVEHFTVSGRGSSKMKHVRTFADGQIATPNNIAAVDQESFYYTNDHGTYKTGLLHELSMIVGTGDVSYCSPTTGCKKVAGGLKFPNGLLRGRDDGLLYVPSAFAGGIHVYREQTGGDVEKVGFIDIPYAIDNLSQDQDGDIFAAALPKGFEVLAAFDNPHGPTPPSTVMRVRKRKDGQGWGWEKILEDAKGEVLPASTTAIHDATTGRIFLSGVFSPFITVCEPRT